MGRATLAPRPGMVAAVPPLRHRPLSTMKDMGMDMSGMAGMDHAAMGHGMAGMDHAAMGHDMSAMAGMTPPPGMAPPAPRGSDVMGDMAGMSMRDPKNAPEVVMGPGVQTIAPMPMDRTGEPGQGLESVGHRVLVYKDLVALTVNPDIRTPTRALDIHLTGNMERFI